MYDKGPIKYYLIHNGEATRAEKMRLNLQNCGLDPNDITWIEHPNLDELSPELLHEIVKPGATLRPGQVSCAYKHYLVLKDIIENRHQLAVVMEDNIQCLRNIPEMMQIYLSQLPQEWDILFDRNTIPYLEGPLSARQLVYPKNNEVTWQCHGGSRGTSFMLMNLDYVKKIFPYYLPFDQPADWWLNDLFRRVHIKSYWAQPANAITYDHVSTATGEKGGAYQKF